MFKSELVIPTVLSIAAIIMGVFVAIQPVIDPGYVHPLGLVLTGLGAAVIGAVLGTVGIAMAVADRHA